MEQITLWVDLHLLNWAQNGAALLPQPKLLVLDEPTNGLDPSGIQEVRNLINELAASGTTIFVSSHLLSELEMICQSLVMLRNGEVLYSGNTHRLLAKQRTILVARPEYSVDLPTFVEIVRRSGFEVEISDDALQINGPASWAPSLNRLAFEAGITLAALKTVGLDECHDLPKAIEFVASPTAGVVKWHHVSFPS